MVFLPPHDGTINHSAIFDTLRRDFKNTQTIIMNKADYSMNILQVEAVSIQV